MTDKLSGKTAKNAKENAELFADHFGNNVFNQTVELAYNQS
eukprot:CAMPEP_0194434224 /NCGR_PEP_ID=MMETSP0176-20130528/81767_1 /TAXON_ID=216777 /ORGANISM="Proboscia alata, Strain PI-D3" /LENGTH=40 /DNA_ID= /DNA_START= /DNA_END= /DNA_ORIENTATION=